MSLTPAQFWSSQYTPFAALTTPSSPPRRMFVPAGRGYSSRAGRRPAKQAFAVPQVTRITRGRARIPRVSLYTLRKKQYVARTPGGNIVADHHYFDTERTATAIAVNTASWTGTEYDPNTSAMLCLFAPVTGDDIFNRSGRKIFVKTIRIRGVLTAPPAATGTLGGTPNQIRIVVYQDKQTNTAQSQGEDLLSQGAGSDAMHMGMNVANLGRFKILKDKLYVMGNNLNIGGATGAFVYSGQQIHFKYDIIVNDWVNYNATNGGTVADVVDNSFHLIANATSGTLTPQITYKVRTTFLP